MLLLDSPQKCKRSWGRLARNWKQLSLMTWNHSCRVCQEHGEHARPEKRPLQQKLWGSQGAGHRTGWPGEGSETFRLSSFQRGVHQHLLHQSPYHQRRPLRQETREPNNSTWKAQQSNLVVLEAQAMRSPGGTRRAVNKTETRWSGSLWQNCKQLEQQVISDLKSDY